MKIAAIISGILYALVCEGFAMMVGGAGHGWTTPFLGGMLGVVVFPLSFYAGVAAENDGESRVLAPAVTAALFADLLLVVGTLSEGLKYVDRVGGFAFVWIAFWLGGQLPLVFAIFRRRRTGRA